MAVRNNNLFKERNCTNPRRFIDSSVFVLYVFGIVVIIVVTYRILYVLTQHALQNLNGDPKHPVGICPNVFIMIFTSIT